MSLTNPNALVTEEHLAEFYQTILPYLGGMPDILANKFSKSKLYDTNEKIVGRWTDGKPLYQKTFPNAFTLGNNGATNFYHQIADIDTIVSFDAYVKAGDGGVLSLPNSNPAVTANGIAFVFAPDHVYARTGNNNYNNCPVTFTVWYTKTSDPAVYIGDDTDYSTDEKIIGTWIDGKPLYQKVYSGLSISVSTSSLTTLVSNLTGISSLIEAVGYAYSGTLIMGFKEVEYNTNTNAVNAIAITSRTLNTLVLRYTKSS